jgi:glycosyltransferase involved in cell wall biosynthesis
MQQASVSVVIPTYNCAALVGQAVESALRQTAEPAEVIVVDDGSTDDTRQRLAPHRHAVRYVFQPNRGVSASRNHGIELASSDFVAFLDADDVWHPRKLERQLQAFSAHPDLGLLGTGAFDWPATAFPRVDTHQPPLVNLVPWTDLVVKNYFTTSSVVVRRELLPKMAAFDTDLQGPEDHDRWLRIAEGTHVANLPEPLTGYRNVPGSLSKQAGRMQQGMHRILRKLDARDAWAGRRLLRRKAYSYVYYSCAYMHSAAGAHTVAAGNLLASLAWYPFAYRRREVRMPLARPKTFLTILLRLARGAAQP